MVIVYYIERGGTTPLTKTGRQGKYTKRRVHFLTLGGKERTAIWRFERGTDNAKRTAWQKARDKFVDGKEEAKKKLAEYRHEHSQGRRDMAKAKTQERRTYYNRQGAIIIQRRYDYAMDDPDR